MASSEKAGAGLGPVLLRQPILDRALLVYFNSMWGNLVGGRNSESLSVAEFTSSSSWFLEVSKSVLSNCPGPFLSLLLMNHPAPDTT